MKIYFSWRKPKNLELDFKNDIVIHNGKNSGRLVCLKMNNRKCMQYSVSIALQLPEEKWDSYRFAKAANYSLNYLLTRKEIYNQNFESTINGDTKRFALISTTVTSLTSMDEKILHYRDIFSEAHDYSTSILTEEYGLLFFNLSDKCTTNIRTKFRLPSDRIDLNTRFEETSTPFGIYIEGNLFLAPELLTIQTYENPDIPALSRNSEVLKVNLFNNNIKSLIPNNCIDSSLTQLDQLL